MTADLREQLKAKYGIDIRPFVAGPLEGRPRLGPPRLVPDRGVVQVSEHRVLCPAAPPELTQPNGPIAGALGNHRHACKHDVFRPDSPDIGGFIEHECECGMTWTLTKTSTEEQP